MTFITSRSSLQSEYSLGLFGVGTRRRWYLIVSILMVQVAVATVAVNSVDARSGGDDPIRIQGTTMGPIPYHVIIASPPAVVNEADVAVDVTEALETINRLMSTYQPESDVSRFNQFESSDWFAVDPETARVVARAIEISRQSEGAFDITVAPAVKRWNFGPDKTEGQFEVPSQAELDQLKTVVDYQSLEVRLHPPAIRKTNPRASIDLSAIAKGYAVDLVGKTLEKLGCQSYMVEVGGEALVKGQRHAGGNWKIGIQIPDELSGDQAAEVLSLTDVAVATSGDYRNFRAIQGKRFSHTIDPRTCAPVENRVASATVIAKDCMTADGVATALMVLGPDRGLELCRKLGLEALVKVRDEEFGDKFTAFQTDNFPPSLTADSRSARAEDAPVKSKSAIWPVFMATAIAFGIAILAMALGAIFGNRPIRGSCGGIANQTNSAGESVCGLCSKPVDQCPDLQSDATRV